jgi:hypothetical protein
VKRLLSKAFVGLLPSEIANIRGVGAVELGLVEVRHRDGQVQRLAVVHAHLLLWGIEADRIRDLLRQAMVKTEIVIRPLQVKIAHDPERLLGYALKHVGDHRATVRGPDGKWFKRRLEGKEVQVQRLWCAFPAADAEVLIGLRRHTGGRITAYTRTQTHGHASHAVTPVTRSRQSRGHASHAVTPVTRSRQSRGHTRT